MERYLRAGSCATNDGLEGFIRKLVAKADRPGKQILLRLDKGLTSGALLDTIEELEAGCVGKVKLTLKVWGQISRIKNWRRIGGGCIAANFRCHLEGWSHPRRFVVIERHLKLKKPSDHLSMFDKLEGRYEVVVTNQLLNAENIQRLKNRGTVVEQVIEEIKNGFATRSIRTNDFWANDALFQTGLIAYNLLNCIRRLALPKGLRTARVK